MPEMVMETPQVGGTLSDPHGIARKFVEQYYSTLQASPSELYRFYLGSSTVIRRGNGNGTMTVTTLEGIHQMIMTMDAGNRLSEITTIDAFPLSGDWVLISVSGYLTGHDHIRRFFVQSFILAQQIDQNSNFFILHDNLHLVDVQAGNLVPVMANGNIHVPRNGGMYLQPNGAVPLQSHGNVPIVAMYPLQSDVVSVPTNGTGSVGTTQASFTTQPGPERHARTWDWPHSQLSECSKPTNAAAITAGPAVQAKDPLPHDQEDVEFALAIKASILSAQDDVLLAMAIKASILSAQNDVPDMSGAVNTSRGAGNGASDKKEGAGTCKICHDMPVKVAFSPCGHLSCMTCHEGIMKVTGTCPYCRDKIRGVLKIYPV